MLTPIALAVALQLAGGPPDSRGSPRRPEQTRDSAAAVDDARDAQARFERHRLRVAEEDRGGGWGGSCDEVLGRMCLRLGESGDWWPGEDGEPPELTEALDGLLDELARAAVDAPGDPWILGQRVTYLIEAGRGDEALALARRCGVSTPGWCAALEGLVEHALGRYAASEAAFERALAAMPPGEARAWEDARVLLDRHGRGLLDDLAPAERAAALRRLWRFSDPLYLVPGNDRRTEHLARRVMARVREDARNPYGMRWGDDLDDLLVRYGWEVGWERQERRPGDVGLRGGAIGHHHPYTLPYVPPGTALRDPVATEPADWNPGSRLRPRTGYAPRYAPVFLPAEGELAVLPRGDRFAVIATLDLPEDTTYHAGHDHPPLPVPAPFRGMPRRRGLYLVPVEGDTVHGITGPEEGGPLVLELPAGRYLASLEVWAPELGRAGRIRRGVAVAPTPADVPTLSDLLLASPRGEEPATLEALLDRLRPSGLVHPGDTVRVAWEIHGLGWRREALAYRLSLTRAQGGLLRAAGRALGLLGGPPSVSLDWRESGPETPGRILRSVLLTVPVDAEPGDYRLRLELGSSGRDALVSERELRVARPGAGRR